MAVLITEAHKALRRRRLPPLDAPWETILDSWYLLRGEAPIKFSREEVEDNNGVNDPDFLTRNIVRICYAMIRRELGFTDHDTNSIIIECGPYVVRMCEPETNAINMWESQYQVKLALKDDNGNRRKQSIANPNPQSREV